MKNYLIIGISGVTCGGKTTTANALNELLTCSKIIAQDDYFLPVDDPRHTWIPELNHIHFDIITSLDMEKMHQDILKHIEDVQEFSILIVEGFSIYSYKPLLDLFDLKYYFTLDKEECLKRRSKRVYDPPDCAGYFERCVWPEYVSNLTETKNSVENVRYFDQCDSDILEVIANDISAKL